MASAAIGLEQSVHCLKTRPRTILFLPPLLVFNAHHDNFLETDFTRLRISSTTSPADGNSTKGIRAALANGETSFVAYAIDSSATRISHAPQKKSNLPKIKDHPKPRSFTL